MDLIQAIILGIVQGITEWFPISSSGHLVLIQNLLNIQVPLLFDVILHFGSLLVILFFYRKEILDLIKGVIKGDKYSTRFTIMLITASIPIAFVGYFFNAQIKAIFNNTTTVGISLLITAIILYMSKFNNNKKKLSYLNTFIIGLVQALAIFPGISRSGSTISIGLLQGIKREEAVKFSLLLSVPAILGANFLEFQNISSISNPTSLIVATLTTIIIGYFSLNLLIKIIYKNKLHYFSIYCALLGILVLIL